VLRQEARRQRQGLPPKGNLQRLEVEGDGYVGPEERPDFAERVRLEGRGEPFFWPAAGWVAAGVSNWASAQASQAAQ
jgi:hypothetical protein